MSLENTSYRPLKKQIKLLLYHRLLTRLQNFISAFVYSQSYICVLVRLFVILMSVIGSIEVKLIYYDVIYDLL